MLRPERLRGSTLKETIPTLCRVCPHGCALLAEVTDGRVTKLTGDRSDPVYEGYLCVKGVAQVEMLRSAERLLGSRKRIASGRLEAIPVERAFDEIALRLGRILDREGPRSVATYLGTYTITTPLNSAFEAAFSRAIGTSMRFAPATVDKPGKYIARALIGNWMAPPRSFYGAEVALLIGINPFVAYQGFPLGNPARWFKEATRRGLKTLVIDPRRTEVARRAHLHLQPRPGVDLAILAGMIRLVLEEGLHDAEFVEEHVEGLAALRAGVQPFTPEVVAECADIGRAAFLEATRTFGRARRRGYVIVGTGPNMSGPGTLIEYLAQSLDTICGNWMRAGETVPNPAVLTPRRVYRAQARPPQGDAFGSGEVLRVRNLTHTAPGMPSSAMAEEMLLEGEGRVRALLCVNGNPAAAFPDQTLTVEALRSLELLVQVDPWMSQTAQLADYVIAPRMPLEMPSTSHFHDYTSNIGLPGYGILQAYGRYAPPIVEPPAGSDLIEEWQLFFRLAQRLGLTLSLATQAGEVVLDMEEEPTADELLELLCRGSRVPLEEVKRYPAGAVFPDPSAVVEPREPGWTGRLQVGDPDMMADLARAGAEWSAFPTQAVATSPERPFRLISRRMGHVMNSACNVAATHRGRPYNPAFMHPVDLRALGVRPGDRVEIRSERGAIQGIVQPDDSVRPGIVSMTHAFGGLPDGESRPEEAGSSTARLVGIADHYDRYSGQPRMSNVPVSVRPAAPS